MTCWNINRPGGMQFSEFNAVAISSVLIGGITSHARFKPIEKQRTCKSSNVSSDVSLASCMGTPGSLINGANRKPEEIFNKEQHMTIRMTDGILTL
jgi:hypothetical protein